MINHRTLIRLIYASGLAFVVLLSCGFAVLIESKNRVYEEVAIQETTHAEPFPVSVDPDRKLIYDEPMLETEIPSNLAQVNKPNPSWWERLFAVLSDKSWYQNLAAPVSRIIVIWPGERKEELSKNVSGVLGWNEAEREEFVFLISASEPILGEGKFYPGKYVVHKDATPAEIASMVESRFNSEILSRYTQSVSASVPLTDALTIASLLEREAGDFENMRQISGVIWNRLFVGMPLQLDATLQYVRGSRESEQDWWPTPRPSDKFIDSPYNTYLNEGLPPGPIASPSSAAVLAALNPLASDCYYYFHDDDFNYHCSATYEEHVAKLQAIYGRGQ